MYQIEGPKVRYIYIAVMGRGEAANQHLTGIGQGCMTRNTEFAVVEVPLPKNLIDQVHTPAVTKLQFFSDLI